MCVLDDCPSIDIENFANRKQTIIYYLLNHILQHSREMAHLLFELLTSKICKIVNMLCGTEIEFENKN